MSTPSPDITKAAGSGLRHYTMQKTRDEIIGEAVKGLEGWSARNGWQPIATAPKDGTVIYLALHEWNDPKNDFCVVWGKWLDGEWMPCGGTDVDELHPPKLWMPFPKPPAVATLRNEEAA